MEIKFVNTGWIPFYLLLLAGLSYLTFLAYSIVQIISEKQKRILIILRITVWTLLIISLINPVITFFQTKKEKSKFIILIDNSASMIVKDRDGTPRFRRGIKILKHGLFKEITKKYNISFYLFDTETKPAIFDKIKSDYSPFGDATDIENALASVSAGGERNIAGIFLLSDGITTVFSDPLKEARILKKLKIPVFAFDFSKNENIKDVSLFDIDYPEETGMDALVPVKLKISKTGFGRTSVLLKIFINDKFYTSKNLILSKTLNNYLINLKFSKSGINKVHFAISQIPGEAIQINNEKTIFIRTFKSKFNVLMVYGKPCWEYKFLHYCFSLDPNIKFNPFVKIKKGSLKPLNKLLLIKYDLIIIGNIKYRDLPPKFVDNLLKYVNLKAGAVLFLGGKNSFRNGDYHISKLKNIIPVVWKKAGELFKGEFTLKLTGIGLNSMVMRAGESDTTAIQEIWANLPPCDTLNIVKAVKPGTQVLAVSSVRQDFVVLAIGKYKRAQIGIFTAYPTWKWGFVPVGLGKSNDVYLNFWRQLVRYMVMYSIEKINITTDKLIYKKAEDIFVRASAYDKNYKPIIRKSLNAKLYHKKDGKYEFVKDIELSPTPGTEGLYETIITPQKFGEYRISLNILGKTKHTYFVIEKPSSELFKLNADTDLLNKICKITDGKFIRNYPDLGEIKKYLKKATHTIKIKREIVLWSSWLPLVIVILCLGYEWYYRKKVGLL